MNASVKTVHAVGFYLSPQQIYESRCVHLRAHFCESWEAHTLKHMSSSANITYVINATFETSTPSWSCQAWGFAQASWCGTCASQETATAIFMVETTVDKGSCAVSVPTYLPNYTESCPWTPFSSSYCIQLHFKFLEYTTDHRCSGSSRSWKIPCTVKPQSEVKTLQRKWG